MDSPGKRVPLADEDGWFDRERSTKWEGEGEALYQTHLGGWVLYTGVYRAVSEKKAVMWLLRNDHPLPPGLSTTLKDLEV